MSCCLWQALVLCDAKNEEFVLTARGTRFYLGVERLERSLKPLSCVWVSGRACWMLQELLWVLEPFLQPLSRCALWDWAAEEPPWLFVHPSSTEARLVRGKGKEATNVLGWSSDFKGYFGYSAGG